MPRGVYNRKTEVGVDGDYDVMSDGSIQKPEDPIDEDQAAYTQAAPVIDLEQIRREAIEQAKAELRAEQQKATAEQAAKAAEEKPAEKRFPVRILRDYWAHDDVRDQWPEDENGHRSSRRMPVGYEAELPITEARRLIGLGVAERNDGLPEI